jgi:hypothetical protein
MNRGVSQDPNGSKARSAATQPLRLQAPENGGQKTRVFLTILIPYLPEALTACRVLLFARWLPATSYTRIQIR